MMNFLHLDPRDRLLLKTNEREKEKETRKINSGQTKKYIKKKHR